MANPSRIAHADFSREWRGGQQQLLLLAQELRRQGCAQTIVAREGSALALRMRREGFEVRTPGWAAVQGADLVHAHEGHAHTWALLAGMARRLPRVLSRRVAFPIQGQASRWKYRRMDRVIAVSEFVRRQVLATGIAPERVRVIPDGLDVAALPDKGPTRPRLRQGAGINPQGHWLVCLSAFTPEKGVDALVAALALLPPACELILTGCGSGEPELRRQAAALGVSARVHFVSGWGYTPAEWVAAAEAMVMPSREEGMGSAALVAMGLGRPVVATAVGGIPEVIEDEVTGLLADENPAALAAACRRVLEDGGLAARLTSAGLERVSQRHALPKLAVETLQLYAEARRSAGW